MLSFEQQLASAQRPEGFLDEHSFVLASENGIPDLPEQHESPEVVASLSLVTCALGKGISQLFTGSRISLGTASIAEVRYLFRSKSKVSYMLNHKAYPVPSIPYWNESRDGLGNFLGECY